MKNIFKRLFIPSGEKTTLIAYNSWVVRWRSWSGYASYAMRETQEAEIFPSEIDANLFAKQLKEAFKLTRCSGECFTVNVEANQSKLTTVTE